MRGFRLLLFGVSELLEYTREHRTQPHAPVTGPINSMSVRGTKRPWIEGQSTSALPQFSDVDLLCNGECIVHLDPQIADRALNLRMA